MNDEPISPWHQGYVEGRAPTGTIQAIPHGPGTDESIEWLNGFEAGREDYRQSLLARPCCGRPNGDCDCDPATQGRVW